MSKRVVESVVLVMGVIMLVLISALIVGSLIGSDSFSSTLTGTNTNETLTSVDNVTASTFDIITTYPLATCTLDSIYNATTGEIPTATNYTFTGYGCTIILSNVSEFNEEDLNVTYGYSVPQQSVGGVDATWVGTQFGLFIVALLGFLAVIGVSIAIVWLLSYIKPLFSKEGGLQTFAGN